MLLPVITLSVQFFFPSLVKVGSLCVSSGNPRGKDGVNRWLFTKIRFGCEKRLCRLRHRVLLCLIWFRADDSAVLRLIGAGESKG
ncbi:hypothetical protein SLA2020_220910 [Shorea laevis]